VREELLVRDPALRLSNGRVPRHLPRPISPEDLSRALLAADPRLHLALCLAAFGGLRAGEIGRLRGRDVDLVSKTVRVDGKGGHERLVPLAESTEVALVAYGYRPGRLFPCARPGQYVSDMVRIHFDGLGMPWRCHSLRHYFGSELYARTRDLRFCQEMLGHASVATTQVYCALAPDLRGVEVVRGMSA
jgi:integrase